MDLRHSRRMQTALIGMKDEDVAHGSGNLFEKEGGKETIEFASALAMCVASIADSLETLARPVDQEHGSLRVYDGKAR